MDKGKYIISEFYSFKPDVNLIKEAEEQQKPIVLSGILQKANTLNRNGRVYPYDILKREANNYMQAVEEGRAMGECVPAGTEIYTKEGWKKIEDVEEGEDILTLDYENDLLQVQSVTATIKKPYNDQMVHIYNSGSLDMMVTKKHKVILWDEDDKPYVITAEEFYERIKSNDSKISHSYIKSSGKWAGENPKNFILPNTNGEIYLDTRFLHTELIDFNDYVYCVSVPNKTWLMKYNISISFTHNCDHPDSAIVSLANVSHKVTDMWWQGEELYGKVMILETPAGDILKGLLKGGVMLGISSRGVGSVKSVRGEDLVQDDFELIAFDFVSSPSTPGAYLFKEGKQWGLTPITSESWKKIKCENGVCKVINDNEENTSITTKGKGCIAENIKHKNLTEIAKNDFWKKIIT